MRFEVNAGLSVFNIDAILLKIIITFKSVKFIKSTDLIEEGVSHDPTIMKKVILQSGLVPQLMQFGEAVFQPGQSVEEHVHETMYETFYILEGKAVFTIESVDYTLEAGDSMLIEQGERHSQSNPFDKPVKWVYFGIATD